MSVQTLPGRPASAPRAATAPLVGVGPGRAIVPFAAAAGVLIIAGGIVAAVNSAAPFDRGSWLAAYLVLVGGVSQALLGGGGVLLRRGEPSRRRIAAQVLLWNLGSLLVPAGVLADAPAAVSAGSAALLAALLLFAVGARASAHRATTGLVAYYALVLALAVSVIVGSALADAPPGGWI